MVRSRWTYRQRCFCRYRQWDELIWRLMCRLGRRYRYIFRSLIWLLGQNGRWGVSGVLRYITKYVQYNCGY